MCKKFSIEKFDLRWGSVCRLFGLALILGTLLACGEDPQQLFETAQFEEQQANHTHARELYEHIIRDHGDSPVARKAEERLKELTKANP